MATAEDTKYHVETQSAREIAMERLHQAWAMSGSIYGGGFESFSNCSEDIQQSFLWALHSLIDDARAAMLRVMLSRDPSGSRQV